MIVTHNLQQATRAATAFARDAELGERGRTTGMLTYPKDEPAERDVGERFG